MIKKFFTINAAWQYMARNWQNITTCMSLLHPPSSRVHVRVFLIIFSIEILSLSVLWVSVFLSLLLVMGGGMAFYNSHEREVSCTPYYNYSLAANKDSVIPQNHIIASEMMWVSQTYTIRFILIEIEYLFPAWN